MWAEYESMKARQNELLATAARERLARSSRGARRGWLPFRREVPCVRAAAGYC